MSALLLAVLAFAPQAQDPEVFTVTEATVDGGAVRYAVSADKRQIHCMDALRELAGAMNWNLDVESTPLENDLRFASVDLNLAGQDPRMVAQLIAVAGGADTVFDEPAAFEGARVTLHVVQQPSAETESGRQRLRAVAGQWYRSFLRDELAYEPLVEKEGNAVRMHLGELLVETGDLESAIGFFQDVYDQQPNDHTCSARSCGSPSATWTSPGTTSNASSSSPSTARPCAGSSTQMSTRPRLPRKQRPPRCWAARCSARLGALRPLRSPPRRS